MTDLKSVIHLKKTDKPKERMIYFCVIQLGVRVAEFLPGFSFIWIIYLELMFFSSKSHAL